MRTTAYAAQGPGAALAPFDLERRALRPDDVALEVLYCGICHTDLHQWRNDWGWSQYPIVPGHEIVGRVVAVGGSVARFEVGQHVAVGFMADSCGQCDRCGKGEEQLCRTGFTHTFNDQDRISGERTYGGYSRHIVVREAFVMALPEGLDKARAAPLLCAGITTYSPLRYWNAGPGSRVGVIGLGGLGHIAVKLAAAMGADVTVISRSRGKEADARVLGANGFLVSTDEAAMAQAASTFDLIIDTVPAKHGIDAYSLLLDVDGTLVLVGQVGSLDEPSTIPLLLGRRRVTGSLIGGIVETEEMLQFCARMNVLPEVEMIRIDQVNTAFDRLERSDVRYRFVIDMASLSPPESTVK